MTWTEHFLSAGAMLVEALVEHFVAVLLLALIIASGFYMMNQRIADNTITITHHEDAENKAQCWVATTPSGSMTMDCTMTPQ